MVSMCLSEMVTPLQAVDFLDFVDEVHLQGTLAEDFQNVVRVAGTVDEQYRRHEGVRLPAR